ncbi:unnamed protein product [Paramecium octaurelia]|uniref:Uncharacterized protein n=1 Tax=Paramecium octaurelia TaxID=43137 RepID=A0A8S1UA50_PAROT|nr:unnamed protein product [Paramecium octaurelia]
MGIRVIQLTQYYFQLEHQKNLVQFVKVQKNHLVLEKLLRNKKQSLHEQKSIESQDSRLSCII